MRLGEGIRKFGFRKWYEGELTRSHLGLVLLLLCAIGVVATLELVTRQAPIADRIGSLVLLLVCAGLGAWSLRRYLFLLMRAEHAASQAICPECRTYGRLELVFDEPQHERLEVRCRNCRHAWCMSDPGED